MAVKMTINPHTQVHTLTFTVDLYHKFLITVDPEGPFPFITSDVHQGM